MNLKKFVKINEEFYDWKKKYYNRGEKLYGIYKNPTDKDIEEIIKEEKPKKVRILLNFKRKNIYLFNDEILHSEAINVIKEVKNCFEFIHGWASLNKKITSMDGLSSNDRQKAASWISKETCLTWKLK